MLRKSLALVLLAAAPASEAHAANLAVITSPPTLLNIVVLAGAVVCTLGAYRVIGLVRGGLLSRSWQFLAGGFAVLALAQLLSLIGALELVALPAFVVPTLLAVMAGLIAYGVYEVARTLG